MIPLLVVLLATQAASASSGDISTFAGGGVGDGGPATGAIVSGPSGVAVDSTGNLFIADTSHHRIRKVSPSGTITTVAGTGADGYSGDGGPATIARLSSVSNVAVDSSGNLFIVDLGNHRIRKVDASGIITTVAGNGAGGYSGDGGPAPSASLSYPVDVAVDLAGNLFIADAGNRRVRKVDVLGTITTVAGNGADGFSGDGGPATRASLSPSGVAVDSIGNIFVADGSNYRVRKVTLGLLITTVAGGGGVGSAGDGGPATLASLTYPSDVAVDSSGSLFIADRGNHRIRKVAHGLLITTVAGNGYAGFYGDGGPATNASLSHPSGVAVDSSGNVLIADTWNNRVRTVGASGTITTTAGNGSNGGYWQGGFSGDGGSATDASLSCPASVAVDSTGNAFIADTCNYRIRKVSPSGTITTVAGNGAAGFSGDGGPATSAKLSAVYSVAVDSSGNLFFADADNYRIRKVSPSGTITTVAGNGAAGYSGDGGPATSAGLYPSAVATDSAGNLFIADNRRVRKVDTSGTITTVAGNGTSGYSGDGGPATSASLSSFGLAVDSAGNLFIADILNNRIRRVDTSGTITTVAGNGTQGYSGDGSPATGASLSHPAGVAFDSAGNLFIADYLNHRIRKVDTSGTITTVAGNGAYADLGDGGPATSATLSYPEAVAFDSPGNLFIADSFNNRIRKVAV